MNKERHAALANALPAKGPSLVLGQLKVLLIGAGVLMTMVGVVTSIWPVLVLGLGVVLFGILKR